MNALTFYLRIATLLCVGWVSTLQAVAVVPDPVAYVTNQGGGVTVLNAHTLKRLDEIAVGMDPRGLAVTPDGRWFCFEVNPSPAFSYYQKAIGQPIAAAVARLLMEGSAVPAPRYGAPVCAAQIVSRF